MNADIPRVDLDSERDLPEPEERVSTEAISAGQLVVPSGGDVALHASDASKPAMLMVARDARERGMEWGDEYPSGAKTPLLRIEGGFINLPLAAGESVAKDDALVPDGNGNVRAAAGDGTESSAHIGIAEEAVDNSGGSEATQVPTEVYF